MEVAEMNSVITMQRRLAQATLMLAAMMAANHALAAGTASGTSVANLATIDYQVGGVAQLAIESSPTGNSTPGAGNGAVTAFVVDNMVDLTVAEVGGGATAVNPGQPGAVTTFTVTNDGNTVQDYALSAANLTSADPAVHGNADTDVNGNNLRVFVDANANGTYQAGTDTATFINQLAPDATVTVFVLIDAPIGAVDADVANVRLTVVTHDAASGAASVTTQTAGADTTSVDVVFADAGRDGLEAADDGYLFSSADLSITKTNKVISDPFNGTTNPKSIPGAVVEYTIELTNNGTVSADGVRVTDVVSSDLALLLAQYNGSTEDIEIQLGAGPASSIFCSADAGDADSDGCGLTGSTLEIEPAGLSVGTTATDNPVRVLFQATIQ
jgi:uncharacterized repeat protein (TIGR01451 family)